MKPELNPDAFMRTVFNDFRAFVCVMSLDGRVVYSNRRAERLFGPELERRCFYEYLPDTKPDDGVIHIDKEWITTYKSRCYKLFEYTIPVMEPEAGLEHESRDEPRIVVIGFEWTEMGQAGEHSPQSAVMDSMTGIYNRQSGIEFLEKLIREVQHGGNSFTVCYIDLNDLKWINDTYGHLGGDEYIQTVVSVVSESIRQTDIFARMGGDEFIILFPGCKHTVVESIMITVSNKLDLINQAREKDGVYSVSYGMMEVNTETEPDLEFILNTVDNKMYYMKEEYRRTKKSRNNLQNPAVRTDDLAGDI